MKKVLVILSLAAVIVFPSCKKCTTCQIKAGSVYESVPEEYCGTEKQVNDFEEDYQIRAENLGITGARAYCNRN